MGDLFRNEAVRRLGLVIVLMSDQLVSLAKHRVEWLANGAFFDPVARQGGHCKSRDQNKSFHLIGVASQGSCL